MEFFKQGTKIDFMKQRKIAYIFSLIVFIASIVSLCVNHLNLGLDFTGGVQVELDYKNTIDLNRVRDQLAQQGLPEASVVRYGSSHDAQVTLPLKDFSAEQDLQTEQLQQQVSAQIANILPAATITRVDYVGPQVGKQLAQQGLLAVVVSLLATMIYIALRFEVRFAVSSAIALIHDPILILGIFSFFHIDFDLIALAAVLTVIGYSLNDTVVIFDRVRENFRKLKKAIPNEVMNLSINQTLSRTIMTSGLTLTVVVVLFLFGGAMLKGFSLALIIGIVIGTYSSIYVAGALAIAMGLEKKHLMLLPKINAESHP
jgi:preprotein translocase subunit SecF